MESKYDTKNTPQNPATMSESRLALQEFQALIALGVAASGHRLSHLGVDSDGDFCATIKTPEKLKIEGMSEAKAYASTYWRCPKCGCAGLKTAGGYLRCANYYAPARCEWTSNL